MALQPESVAMIVPIAMMVLIFMDGHLTNPGFVIACHTRTAMNSTARTEIASAQRPSSGSVLLRRMSVRCSQPRSLFTALTSKLGYCSKVSGSSDTKTYAEGITVR
jgi:hypothetical protein